MERPGQMTTAPRRALLCFSGADPGQISGKTAELVSFAENSTRKMRTQGTEGRAHCVPVGNANICMYCTHDQKLVFHLQTGDEL